MPFERAYRDCSRYNWQLHGVYTRRSSRRSHRVNRHAIVAAIAPCKHTCNRSRDRSRRSHRVNTPLETCFRVISEDEKVKLKLERELRPKFLFCRMVKSRRYCSLTGVQPFHWRWATTSYYFCLSHTSTAVEFTQILGTVRSFTFWPLLAK